MATLILFGFVLGAFIVFLIQQHKEKQSEK
jgi:hypothetical protein